jgi:hypothetical protein
LDKAALNRIELPMHVNEVPKIGRCPRDHLLQELADVGVRLGRAVAIGHVAVVIVT